LQLAEIAPIEIARDQAEPDGVEIQENDRCDRTRNSEHSGMGYPFAMHPAREFSGPDRTSVRAAIRMVYR
jgi:hypothetical protein